ncbi:MAG: hypothetical protein WCC64_05390 [Aliidongia sp.]
MTRLSILSLFLVGLALAGCGDVPSDHLKNPSDTTKTGTLIPGVNPEALAPPGGRIAGGKISG